MEKVKFSFQFIILFILIYLNSIAIIYACPLKITVENISGVKEFCPQKEDSSIYLQEAIDYAASKEGGIIYLSHGFYQLDHPVYLKSNISILGKPNLTVIYINGVFGFTQKNEDIINKIHIKDIIFKNKSSKTKSVFYITGGLQYSIFENLTFYGFSNQTLINLSPDFNGKPPRNVIFNHFRNIYADECGKCIIYNGSTFSRITCNVWDNIVFRKIFNKGIEAVNWVDTEKWFNLYMMAESNNVILIDINAFNREHAHGFHFYSPILVYSPKLKKESKKPVAIRIGRGTIRNIFLSVATDKVWDKFLLDDGATSYYIIMDRGIEPTSVKKKIRILQKGVLSFIDKQVNERLEEDKDE